MNRYGIALLVLLPLSMSASADDYTEMLGKAERMERALASKQKIALSQAKTGEMKDAMNLCEEQVGKMPPGMGVVFEIDDAGAVTQTWTRNGTAYEDCFAETMQERIEFEPPMDPFYTALDYGG